MTDNFIAFFYRERLLVAVVSLLIMAGGILALSRLNVDAFPDVTPVQVEIDTEGQGLAPQEVEQLITFPIENVMNGIPGVVRVQSISKFGLSVVTVYFRDDVDVYFARQQVFERLSLAKDSIPAGFEPQMGPITTGTGQVYLYEIVGRGKSTQELRTIQDWIVKLQLRTVPGVADVLSFGGDVKQYHVIVDQQRRAGLSRDMNSPETNQRKHQGGDRADKRKSRRDQQGAARRRQQRRLLRS